MEARETIGGGVRSAELTLPGFIHDICSAVHPLALSSPFFRQLELHRYGLEWIQPEIPLAHPFEDGEVLCLHRSLEVTADVLGSDGKAYSELLSPLWGITRNSFRMSSSPYRSPDTPFSLPASE